MKDIRQRNSDRNRSGNGSNSSSGLLGAITQIRQLDFPSFQTLVLMYVRASGHQHMRSLGRNSRQGRRQQGGADFVALLAGPDEMRVAIQVRHRKTKVGRQAVDELRGFLLREGIPAGIIVTNSEFQPSASRTVRTYPGRPITLVSNWGLAQFVQSITSARGLRAATFFDSLGKVRLASTIPSQKLLPPGPKRADCLEDQCEAMFGNCTVDWLPASPWLYWLIAGDALLFFLITLCVFHRWPFR